MPKLTFLDLSQNKIEGVPFNSLSYAVNLKILNLESNRIQNDIMGVGSLLKLRMLNLKGNLLHNMDSVHQLANLRHLRFLDISNNRLA
jgi:Leucine-rich repeat (LRR) protein